MIAEVALIAVVVFQEARGESFTGQVAVAEVIRNRVHSQCHPNSVRGVVFQKRQFAGIGRPGIAQTPAEAKAKNPAAWETAVRAAKTAVLHRSNVVQGATHFTRADHLPKWVHGGADFKKVGQHIFMRMRTGC